MMKKTHLGSIILVLAIVLGLCACSADSRRMEDFQSHHDRVSSSSTENLDMLEHIKDFFRYASEEVPSGYTLYGDTLTIGEDWCVRYRALYESDSGRTMELYAECSMQLSFAIIDCIDVGNFLGEPITADSMPDLGSIEVDFDYEEADFADQTSAACAYYADMVTSGLTPWG